MSPKLGCPRCGKPVTKAGTQNHGAGKTGVQRYECYRGKKRHGCGWRGTQPIGVDAAKSAGVDARTSQFLARQVDRARGVQRYVITAAQNATPVNRRFFTSLLKYCQVRDARLLVVPYRYKNPTSMWTATAQDDDWWAPELAAYLIDLRVDLNRHLVLLADIKTQPTASTPLQGFETLTGGQSAIVGHPKLELVAVPTPQQRLPKLLITTGAVTEKNYIPSKAGKKGEHHHTFGACVVEIDGSAFHLRQINATRAGSFIDLDREYDGNTIRPTVAAALVMGDTHVDFADPDVTEATFGPRGIVALLRPRQLVWHDVLDFHSRSHHHRADPFIQYAKHHASAGNVEAELDRCYAYIDRHTPPGVRNVVVASNHHEHLARWVKESDPRLDPENAVFWAKTFTAMCLGSKMTDSGPTVIDPFAWWAREKLGCFGRTTFLARGQSHVIEGIDVGFHGDHGANGSRGSLRGYGKIGVKTVTGHTHTPGIRDGAYQVGGGSRLGLTYLRGPSSWLHTHCVIYANGKRSLINVIGGKWRA